MRGERVSANGRKERAHNGSGHLHPGRHGRPNLVISTGPFGPRCEGKEIGVPKTTGTYRPCRSLKGYP
jgi:hypothetical protein